MGIEASSTGDHAQLDSVQETVARLIDDYCGFQFFPSSDTRYFTARNSQCLALDTPLLAVDSVRLDLHGDGTSYDTTMTSACYYLEPYNATNQSPPKPYWNLELRQSATMAFPSGDKRAVQIIGTFGYYNKTTSIATIATANTSNTTRMEFNNSSLLHPGMTLLAGSERIYVKNNGKSGSDTATSSGSVFVERAVNGTTAATHASGETVYAYEYPVIDQAALTQAEQAYLVRHSPQGYAGGDPYGQQRPQISAGLHPFVRSLLEPFRKPVAL